MAKWTKAMTETVRSQDAEQRAIIETASAPLSEIRYFWCGGRKPFIGQKDYAEMVGVNPSAIKQSIQLYCQNHPDDAYVSQRQQSALDAKAKAEARAEALGTTKAHDIVKRLEAVTTTLVTLRSQVQANIDHDLGVTSETNVSTLTAFTALDEAFGLLQSTFAEQSLLIPTVEGPTTEQYAEQTRDIVGTPNDIAALWARLDDNGRQSALETLRAMEPEVITGTPVRRQRRRNGVAA